MALIGNQLFHFKDELIHSAFRALPKQKLLPIVRSVSSAKLELISPGTDTKDPLRSDAKTEMLAEPISRDPFNDSPFLR